jgi:hypothetical protein
MRDRVAFRHATSTVDASRTCVFFAKDSRRDVSKPSCMDMTIIAQRNISQEQAVAITGQ